LEWPVVGCRWRGGLERETVVAQVFELKRYPALVHSEFQRLSRVAPCGLHGSQRNHDPLGLLRAKWSSLLRAMVGERSSGQRIHDGLKNDGRVGRALARTIRT